MGDMTVRSNTGIFILWSGVLLVLATATCASITQSSSPVAVEPPHTSVDHFRKGDRLTRRKTGDGMGAVAVELSGRSDIVVRDLEGNILFAVDNAAHTTTVAKQLARGAPSRKNITAPVETDLPDGCEGAFSPYAEPSMAGVIGRCVSTLLTQSNFA
jgi:hypothetical protein